MNDGNSDIYQQKRQQQQQPINMDTQFNVIMNSRDPKGNFENLCWKCSHLGKKEKEEALTSLLNALGFLSYSQIYVTQHPTMHHPLKTRYDSVVDELSRLSYLSNLSHKTRNTSPFPYYQGKLLTTYVSR